MHITDESCAFNRIYKLNASVCLGDTTVEQLRANLSSSFAEYLKSLNYKFDAISPIPNTGRLYTPIMSSVLNVENVDLFEKVRTLRTLKLETTERKEYYNTNLGVIEKNIKKFKNAHILFVDEALLSGITIKAVTNLCAENNIKKFSFAFMSPPNYLTCPFSHIRPKNRILSLDQIETLGTEKMIKSLTAEISAQNIFFTPYSLFKKVIGGKHACTLCFLNHD